MIGEISFYKLNMTGMMETSGDLIKEFIGRLGSGLANKNAWDGPWR